METRLLPSKTHSITASLCPDVDRSSIPFTMGTELY